MRRVRPGIVLAGSILALLAAVVFALWSERDLLRESSLHYLRERLAQDYGAEFDTGAIRGRWFPPVFSLGRVTFQRRGEPWVLTVEDVKVSFNIYALLFRRERLSKLTLHRPHLFLRLAPQAGNRAAAGTPEMAGAAKQRLGTLFRPPLPFRALEVKEGRIEVRDPAGKRFTVDGLDLGLLVFQGKAQGKLGARRIALAVAERQIDLGAARAELAIENGRIAVREFASEAETLTSKLRGNVDIEGDLELEGELVLRLERLVALLGPGLRLGGTVHFAGKATGRWNDPRVEGLVSLGDPVIRGQRWPACAARVSWRDRELSWKDLRLSGGGIVSQGSVGFGTAVPRYRIEAEARDFAPARLPAPLGTPPSRVAKVSGSVVWEGEGFSPVLAAGHGSLRGRVALAGWSQDEVDVEAEASLAAGTLQITAFRAGARALAVNGSGRWRPEEGLEAHVVGKVGELGRFGTISGAAFDGDLAFDGEVRVGAEGPRFTGPVRLERGTVGRLKGINATMQLAAGAEAVLIRDGRLEWPGGKGRASGSLLFPSGRIAGTIVMEQFSLAAAAQLLGADPGLIRGTVAAKADWTGTLSAPEVAGEVAGGPFQYRKLTVDSAALEFSYAGKRLGITELRIARGSTNLVFSGELRDGQTLAGDFQSPAFNLQDFLPDAGVELAGMLRGRLDGPVRTPALTGQVRADRLRYAGWDLKGGVIDVDYRGGKAVLKGWIVEEANRLRAVLEPAFDWRFETDLELKQFSPEMLRPGLGALPPALGLALEKAAFLAAGRLQARGRLGDLASLHGDLTLDTLWFQAAGKTLQNQAPVKITWREGELLVESLRLSGDQYHLEVRGKGGPASGWDLQAEGAVNLGLFGRYWSELEEVDGLGDIRLAITGPWLSPVPEGNIVVRSGYVKARSLPEPLDHLEGRFSLHGRVLEASGLSGTIGSGNFRGEGRYGFADDRLAAEVQGRLDLALFRGRVPAARELRGPVEVRLRMEGPLAAPAFSGDVEVLDAELFARPFPAKITHVKGKILVDADKIAVRELTGQIGGGTLRLSGTMAWTRKPARVDFDLEGREILLSLAGAVKAQADLQLGLHGDFTDLKLAGEVRLLKGRYLLEFNEKPPLLTAGGDLAGAAAGGGGAPGTPDLGKLALEVKVRATDNIWISNKMAKIEASLALDIGGTLGKPVIRGEILGIQGEAYYLSRYFRLESGSLRFVPSSLMPQLDLQASTTVGATQILFLMDGPLNKLNFHLTSLPAMSQQDLIALLTIGETRASIAKRGDRATAMGAAVFTTEPIVNALGDEARTAMGVEILQLEPIIGENNQVSARLTVGTHLSDRLFVSYSQNLGATEDQQVKVEYHLLDYLSLWGQELRQGVYSLDLVFRYAFR